MTLRRLTAGFGAVLLAASLASAAANETKLDSTLPPALRGVGVDQKLDQPLPADLHFRDENGKTVRLGDLFDGRPVLLTLAYYHCPMLCPMVLDSLVRSLRPLSWNLGEKFRAVTVSIDPKETPEQAAAMKKKLVDGYGRAGAADGWTFLVGDEDAIRQLADAVGFRYRYDAENDQYAHAAALMVVTPQGRLSRYLYGIDYTPRDVRLSLVEASEGKIGTLADQLLLFCFHYDPATGRYGAAALNSLRVAGVLTVACLVGFVTTQIRRERIG